MLAQFISSTLKEPLNPSVMDPNGRLLSRYQGLFIVRDLVMEFEKRDGYLAYIQVTISLLVA